MSLLGLATFFPNHALANDKLNIAFSVFPPLVNTPSPTNQNRPGALIEFYSNILPKLGYEIDLVRLPPKRIVALMNKGKSIDLYACADYTKGTRPLYAYGPPLIFLTVNLFQNASEPILQNIKDLKNQSIIKQHGFDGLKKLLDKSNTFFDAHAAGVASMFSHGRANYLLDFKERIELMLKNQAGTPEYRIYPVRSFIAHLCLNRRLKNAEARIQKIHNAFVEFQETPAGRKILAKYRYSGRFGAQFQTAGEK